MLSTLRTICPTPSHVAAAADALLAKRSPHRVPRRLLQAFWGQWCTAREPLSAMAARLHISVSAISLANHRLAQELPDNRDLRKHLKALEQAMNAHSEGEENL